MLYKLNISRYQLKVNMEFHKNSHTSCNITLKQKGQSKNMLNNIRTSTLCIEHRLG